MLFDLLVSLVPLVGFGLQMFQDSPGNNYGYVVRRLAILFVS
ncbi:hypothetical protein QO002_005680 [Pararhizobium capsulatum DSM 1112]|uniref:Uncharacterized protein n=1 Tax=Pararhizobium capsulatum DSM 1112 TaxID=1121113 RepID=A0ABU0BYZ9_9HYPH|nr:hypothetical protein [Pararhizobium capsulatum DSM 1112]